MIRSQPILPIRFYNDLHDQDRFNIFHKRVCDTYLNYPPNALPSFQITRPQSLATPTSFILKNICNDPPFFNKIIPEQASNFGQPQSGTFYTGSNTPGTYDNVVDAPTAVTVDVFSFDCGRLVGLPLEDVVTTTPFANIYFPTPLNNLYSLKIIVDKFHKDPLSSFRLLVFNNSTQLGEITAPGVYTYYFLATAASVAAIVAHSYRTGDSFEISYMQCTLEANNALFLTDVELDETDLDIMNTKENTDIISWCDNAQAYNVAPGEYYYQIKFSDGSYYYSELFNVKSYKEIEKFYRLTWYNSTDMNAQIIYDTSVITCGFKNVLHLDASLFNPEYDTTVENIKNGENEDIPVFNKWQKSITLQIMKAPEFLADALSAIFLHDNIYLRNPLNRLQENQSDEYEVIRSISEVNSVLDDAFQKVELKLLLADNYTKANCEEAVEEKTCDNVYQYKAAVSSGDADYYLTITGPPTAGDGLYRHSDNVLIEPLSTDLIFNFDTGRYHTLEFITGIWKIVKTYPVIVSNAVVGLNYDVIGVAIPNTFVKVQYNYDGGGWVDSLTGEVDSNGDFLVSIPTSLSSGATDFDIRVKNILSTCELATSSSVDVV